MKDITITLNSKIVRQRLSGQTPQNFSVKLDKVLDLPADKRYKIALLKLSAVYSWHNISSTIGNNVIKYSPDGGTSWANIVFDNGIYSYSDINSFIHSTMKANGHYTVVDAIDVFDVELTFNLSTFLVQITLTNSYQIDLNTQLFSDLIGYDVGIVTTSQSGVRLPDITRSLDTILVHCSLVEQSITDGEYSDIIFSYPTASLTRSYSYAFEPNNLIFHPMWGNRIDTITIRTTDVTNKEIDFNGIDQSLVLIIREDI